MSIKTELWESREHEEIMMKGIKKKRWVLTRKEKREQRMGDCGVSERTREGGKKWKRQDRPESNERDSGGESIGEMMICGSLQCASVTGMALQGSMKSLLIVRSGNRSPRLLALIDLFTFQRLDPAQKKMMRGSQGINIW